MAAAEMDLEPPAAMPAHKRQHLEKHAAKHWDSFYRRNEDRFFKDRHYLASEFPELLAADKALEVGCGAGNSIFPLLKLNPRIHVFACDFSATAVAIVRRHPAYATPAAAGQLTVFKADITQDDLCLAGGFPAHTIGVCTLVFVLSAIAPAAMPQALAQLASTLCPGGRVLFRDYAAGDLAAERLGSRVGQLLGEGKQQYFTRWDGTQAFFFTEEFLRHLFATAGFVCEYVRIHERTIQNHKECLAMQRRWVQAVFWYDVEAAAAEQTSAAAAQQQLVADSRQQQIDANPHSAPQQSLCSWCDKARAPQHASVEMEQQQVQLGSNLRLHVHLPSAQRARLEASCALARLLLLAPLLLYNATVIELECQPAPLSALAALRWCSWAVATDSSSGALQQVRFNAQLNAPLFVIERLRLAPLPLGSTQQCSGLGEQQQQQIATILKHCPAGFDLVLCSASMAISRLTPAVAALLSQRPGACALLYGCDSNSSWSHDSLSGLQIVPLPAELTAAACASGIDQKRLLMLMHLSTNSEVI